MKRYLPTRPTLPDVVERFAMYYQRPGNGAWGRLHIVLDDGNVGDDCVLFCKQWALEEGDAEGATLADVLLTLSRSQRARLSWKVDQWLERQAKIRRALTEAGRRIREETSKE